MTKTKYSPMLGCVVLIIAACLVVGYTVVLELGKLIALL